MTPLESAVRKARTRITINRWFNHLCTAVLVAAAGFAAIALIVRLWGGSAPLPLIAPAMLSAALIISIIWATATRVDLPTAAAALDQAAGLRERLSSGLYCQRADDPFKKAVLTDAEQTSRTIAVHQHLRYTAPPRLAAAALAVLLAAITPLAPDGWLVKAEDDAQEQVVEARHTAAVIKKRTQRIKRTAATNAELKKMVDDLDKLGEAPDGRLKEPTEQRNLALKKLDRLQDAIKQERAADRFERAKEFKKMLRGLTPTKQPDNTLAKVANALAAGDFKNAREQLQHIQKQLAKMGANSDQAKRLQAQLQQLAKKLEALADDKKLKQQLTQAGLKKEDIERMLKHPTPKDIKIIRKQLEKKGLSRKAVDRLTKQLQKRSGAGAMARQLANAMQAASASLGQGQQGQAAGALGAAAGQLSEIETLEQEMNSLDAMMADVRGARSDLSKPCSKCNGTGYCNGGTCAACGGNGTGGMGPNMGHGRGGIASEQRTPVSFVKRRQKVYSGKGAIIGQYLVDGEQYKGEVSPAVREIITAAESDATDAVDRARIPRRFHKAVKQYFSGIQQDLGITDRPATADDDDPPNDNPSHDNHDHDAGGATNDDN